MEVCDDILGDEESSFDKKGKDGDIGNIGGSEGRFGSAVLQSVFVMVCYLYVLDYSQVFNFWLDEYLLAG